MEERVGVGEDLAQNKQVLRLVAYRAGGPDVSQEAPVRLSTIFRRVSLPGKKLWDGGSERMEATGFLPGLLSQPLYGSTATITTQSETQANKWSSSTL